MRHIHALLIGLFLITANTGIAFAEEAAAPAAEEADAEAPAATGSEAVEEAVEAAPATEEAPTAEGKLDEAVSGLAEAVNSKNWTLVLAFALMLLVAVWQKIGRKLSIPRQYLPAASSLMAVAAVVSTTLLQGGSILESVLQGLVVGTSASGLWSLVGKPAAAKMPGKKD